MDVKSIHMPGACRQPQWRKRGVASRNPVNSPHLLTEHDFRPLILEAEESARYFLKDVQQRWPIYSPRLAVRLKWA